MKKFRIADVHAHIFPEKIREKAVASIGHFYDIVMDGRGGGEDLLVCGNAIGVEKYCIHSVATVPAQAAHINDYLHAEAQAHSEFVPLAAMHPAMENIEGELDRVRSFGFAGIKLHPDFQKFDIDDPMADRLYKAAGNDLVILFHMGDERYEYSKPAKLARVLDKFPEMRAIAAHYGGFMAWEEARSCLCGRDVWYDTSSSLFKIRPDEAADMAREHGIEKMLWGSDYPMWVHNEELERFMAIPFAEAEREAIFWNNAAALFGF